MILSSPLKCKRVNILTPHIEESYRRESTDYHRRNLRFSDAGIFLPDGEKCERAVIYDLYNTYLYDNEKPEIRQKYQSGSLALFDDGRLHEAEIRRRLTHILKSPEMEMLEKETGAKGKIDNLVRIDIIREALKEQLELEDGDPILQDLPILEIKSANQFQFHEMANSEQVLLMHYDQVQMYLRQKKKPIAIVFVKNRNGFGPGEGFLPYLEFVVFSDPGRQKEILEGWRRTKDIWEKVERNLKRNPDISKSRNLPRRPFLKDSSTCRFCRYRKACWGPDQEQSNVSPEPDETVEAPSKELVDSAIKSYAAVDGEIKKLTETKSGALTVIKNYFRATGERTLISGNLRATGFTVNRKRLDKDFLLKKLGGDLWAEVADPVKQKLEDLAKRDSMTKQKVSELIDFIHKDLYPSISEPSAEKLKALISQRKFDSADLERALISYGEEDLQARISVLKPKTKRVKEESDADKGHKRNQAAPKNGKNPAGSKRSSKK